MNELRAASVLLMLVGWSVSCEQRPVAPTKAQWHEDFKFMARELADRHANAFHSISRELFAAEVAQLDRELDQLNSDEIYVGMDRIANLIGDGHTNIRIPPDAARFPIQIARFGNEYRIAAVGPGNETALGARVVKIQDTPIDRACELLYSLTPSDETQVLRDSRIDGFLTVGMLLHGSGIIQDRNVARYTLADDNGKEFSMDVHAVVPADSSTINWTYAFKERALFRQRPDQSFWYTYLPESRTVYCSFRGYQDLGQAKGLFQLIQQRHPDRLVIDLRLNGGGDYEEGLRYVVHPVRDLASINRMGHLFILIGPGTFSAAMSNAAHFRYQTNAILAGEQIGEKPNSYQEARDMKLPNSHWVVRYSVKFYKFVETGENLIRPDQQIETSWDDYKAGRDPVLEWVLRYGM